MSHEAASCRKIGEMSRRRRRRCHRRRCMENRKLISSFDLLSRRRMQSRVVPPCWIGMQASGRRCCHGVGLEMSVVCRVQWAHQMSRHRPAMINITRRREPLKLLVSNVWSGGKDQSADLFSEVASGFVPGSSVPYVSNRFGADVIFSSQINAWCCQPIRRIEGRFVLKYLDNLIF